MMKTLPKSTVSKDDVYAAAEAALLANGVIFEVVVCDCDSCAPTPLAA